MRLDILILLIVFLVAMISSYSIRRFIRGNLFLRILRVLIINLPYLLIFIWLPLPKYNFKVSFFACMVVSLLAFINILLDYKNLKLANNSKFFTFLPVVEGKHLISRFSELTIIPIIEELFYRGSIPIDGSETEIIIFSIVTAFLFNVAHYIGNNKTMGYHIRLFIFSIISICIYLYSHNIIYPIIFHIIYNLPWFIVNCRMYYFAKRRGEI